MTRWSSRERLGAGTALPFAVESLGTRRRRRRGAASKLIAVHGSVHELPSIRTGHALHGDRADDRTRNASLTDCPCRRVDQGAIAMDVSRMRYLCGILHRTGLAGRRQPERTVDLRRSRRGFPTRHATRAATRWSPTLDGTGVRLAAAHGPVDGHPVTGDHARPHRRRSRRGPGVAPARVCVAGSRPAGTAGPAG